MGRGQAKDANNHIFKREGKKLSKDRKPCTKAIMPLWSVKLRRITVIRGPSRSLNVTLL